MLDKKDIILCGMYDKTCIPHEKDLLYKGIVPENVKEFILEDDENGYTYTTFSRKDFSTIKKDGTIQYYYGWYMLIPENKEILFLCENNGSFMNFDFLKLKESSGSDLIINHNGIKYYVYGKFNVAKTSDNWCMKVTVF